MVSLLRGQAGKIEHLLDLGDIPLVQSDRGGQVTYHGPGQIVLYTLIPLKNFGLSVRDLVRLLENTVIAQLADYGIEAKACSESPGVYVDDKKIASLGLRIRHGVSFHGIAVNVNMDLDPFSRINPCGHPGFGGSADFRSNRRYAAGASSKGFEWTSKTGTTGSSETSDDRQDQIKRL